MDIYGLWKTVIIIFATFVVSECSTEVIPQTVFFSQQFAVLDSSLTFTTKILNPANDEHYLVHWWEPESQSDLMKPRETFAELNQTNGYTSNWTLDFPQDYFSPSSYKIYASVTYPSASGIPSEATKQLGIMTFKLSKNFTGKVIVNDNDVFSQKRFSLASTKNETEVKVTVDNTNFLKNATDFSWSWFIDGDFITNTTEPLFRHNFSHVTTYYVTGKLIAAFKDVIKPNATVIKRGVYEVGISAKEPINNVNITGNTWYPDDGQLLRLRVTFNGTYPIKYCFIINKERYNMTGNETCSNLEMTNSAEINFVHLLPRGTHVIVLILENKLGSHYEKIDVVVYPKIIEVDDDHFFYHDDEGNVVRGEIACILRVEEYPRLFIAIMCLFSVVLTCSVVFTLVKCFPKMFYVGSKNIARKFVEKKGGFEGVSHI